MYFIRNSLLYFTFRRDCRQIAASHSHWQTLHTVESPAVSSTWQPWVPWNRLCNFQQVDIGPGISLVNPMKWYSSGDIPFLNPFFTNQSHLLGTTLVYVSTHIFATRCSLLMSPGAKWKPVGSGLEATSPRTPQHAAPSTTCWLLDPWPWVRSGANMSACPSTFCTVGFFGGRGTAHSGGTVGRFFRAVGADP
jgi:hypothetical protein